MAEETQAVAEGAAGGAPTAPHATPKAAGGPAKRTGPERFWDGRRVRWGLAGALALSFALHAGFGPWSFFPEESFEVVEVEGDPSIPIDLIDESVAEEPPAPEAPEPPEPEANHEEGNGARPDAGRKEPVRDAGAPPPDAEALAEGLDASVAIEGDAGATKEELDAALAQADEDGGVPGANGPRDPTALVGAAGDVQAGPALVQLLINMEEIRKNPTGARMGPLLSAIPQWDDFMQGTGVDPVRDTDWVLITGPSLIRTERDVILVHYSASDALVDKAIQVIAKKYDRGGAFDAGVPGVKAALGHADRAPRVFLRPQSRVLAVVPPDYAHTAAKSLHKARISARVRPGEAMRLVLKTPSRPFPRVPSTISEMRLWILPRADGGADVHAEGDTPDADSGAAAAAALRKVIRDQNSVFVRMVTNGLLDTVEITADGSVVRLRAPVSRDQLETLLSLVASQLGVTLPMAPHAPGATSR